MDTCARCAQSIETPTEPCSLLKRRLRLRIQRPFECPPTDARQPEILLRLNECMGGHNPFVFPDGWSFHQIGTHKPKVLQTPFVGLAPGLSNAGS